MPPLITCYLHSVLTKNVSAIKREFHISFTVAAEYSCVMLTYPKCSHLLQGKVSVGLTEPELLLTRHVVVTLFCQTAAWAGRLLTLRSTNCFKEIGYNSLDSVVGAVTVRQLRETSPSHTLQIFSSHAPS